MAAKSAQQPAPLWRCKKCGARFTTRNQSHSCGRFELEPLFLRSEPQVRAIFARLVALIDQIGPVTVIPQKTRIAIQVRMRFCAVTPQKSSLLGHLILTEKHPAACIEKIEELSPRCFRHVFRFSSPEQITSEFRRLAKESYKVGAGEHRRR